MTGYKPTPVLEYPAYGAVVSQLHHGSGVLPSNIAVPSFNVGGSRLTGSGYLPAATRPFSVGESPLDRPVTPSDLAATIYTLLGIDPKKEFHTGDGRPVRISPYEAEPVSELIA